MFSWLSWFFDDLFYYIAIIALIGGVIAYTLSYLVGFLPMLKAHALILKVLGIFLVITGGYYVSDHHGYQRRMAEDQVEIDRLNQEARAKEQELNEKVNQTASALRKANNEAQTKISKLTADVQSGVVRLSIPISSNALCATDSSRAANGDSTTRAELDAKASANLISITADGDKAIRSLNACIASYNEVRQTLMEKIE